MMGLSLVGWAPARGCCGAPLGEQQPRAGTWWSARSGPLDLVDLGLGGAVVGVRRPRGGGHRPSPPLAHAFRLPCACWGSSPVMLPLLPLVSLTQYSVGVSYTQLQLANEVGVPSGMSVKNRDTQVPLVDGLTPENVPRMAASV